MKRLFAPLWAGLALFTLSSVLPGARFAAEAPPRGVKSLAKGNTKFAVDLYSQLRTKEGNLFLSPYSISTALAMTSAGARGKTLEQMTSVLHLPDQTIVHPAAAFLIKEYNGAGRKRGYELNTANALWTQKGYKFLPEFLRLMKKDYGSGLQQVDFIKETEQSRKTINRWVEKQTQDKIKNLIPPGVLNLRTRLVLTNAIYFKGDWLAQFKKDGTRDADFSLSADKKVKTPLMHQESRFGYFETRDLQVLQMPYAGKELSMVVVLPKKIDGLAAVEKTLSADTLGKWFAGLQTRKVKVYLPRFKLTSQFSLKKELSALGMEEAFSTTSDFSGMDGTKDLAISEVVHKAFVDVNEKGTEAAAATGVIVGVRAVAPTIPEFRADHPFLFVIRDTRFDNVLFMGRLVHPLK